MVRPATDAAQKAQAKAKRTSKTLQTVSPAEFFATNREIAGFDNTGKCLYTTIRELVENALDSAESIGVLPDVTVTIEEISEGELNKLIGVEQMARIDEALYKNFETDKMRQKRLAKEAKEREKAGAGGVDAPLPASPLPKGRSREDNDSIFRIRCRDNGRGMPHDEIPNMLGKVLSSTNYCLRQTRGKYGLGAKMALIWSKMSTSQPIEVESAQRGADFVSRYTLDIDIKRNAPIIIKEEKAPIDLQGADAAGPWHGAELIVTIKGNWKTYGHRVLSYFRQLAVITPYAQLGLQFRALNPEKNVNCTYQRRTESVPPVPMETKYHPSAVDLHVLRKLAEESKSKSLHNFFTKDFEGIGTSHAQRLVNELGEGMDEKQPPSRLSDAQLMRIHKLFSDVKFDPPTGDTLSPAGEYNLRLGIMKEISPVLIATYQGQPGVFQGHSFQIEVGVSIGGKDVRSGKIQVHRFANRIPLLFEGGTDVCTTVAESLNWSSYKINPKEDKLSVFVSIVSTKVPFRGTSKESISSESKEISDAIKTALQNCGKQLRVKITKAHAARDRQRRKKDMEQYVPTVAHSLYSVLQNIVEDGGGRSSAGKKRGREMKGEDADLISKCKRGELKEHTIADHLRTYIERIDTALELDYAEKVGAAEKDRCEVFLPYIDDLRRFGETIHANALSMRLLPQNP